MLSVFMEGTPVNSVDWKGSLQRLVLEQQLKPLDGMVVLLLAFYVRRPHYHFDLDGKLLRSYQMARPEVSSALLRMARLVDKTLAGVAYAHTARVERSELTKSYAAGSIREGVSIKVFENVNYADAISQGTAW